MISPISLLAPSLGKDLSVATRKIEGAAIGSFSDMLNSVVTQGISTLRQGEQTGMKAIEGSATTQDVVDSVMAAERSLQTAISIRDKLVSAFQEISRMPI